MFTTAVTVLTILYFIRSQMQSRDHMICRHLLRHLGDLHRIARFEGQIERHSPLFNRSINCS